MSNNFQCVWESKLLGREVEHNWFCPNNPLGWTPNPQQMNRKWKSFISHRETYKYMQCILCTKESVIKKNSSLVSGCLLQCWLISDILDEICRGGVCCLMLCDDHHMMMIIIIDDVMIIIYEVHYMTMMKQKQNCNIGNLNISRLISDRGDEICKGVFWLMPVRWELTSISHSREGPQSAHFDIPLDSHLSSHLLDPKFQEGAKE